MNEYKFYCKNCEQPIMINDGHVGTVIKCPSCSDFINVPKKKIVNLKKILKWIYTNLKKFLIWIDINIAVKLYDLLCELTELLYHVIIYIIIGGFFGYMISYLFQPIEFRSVVSLKDYMSNQDFLSTGSYVNIFTNGDIGSTAWIIILAGISLVAIIGFVIHEVKKSIKK